MTEVKKADLDKHNLMKQELFEEFQLKYTQLVRFVQSMPLATQMKMNGFTRADEFYFWIREAISHIQFVAPPVETPPEPTEPELKCEPIESPPLE